MFLNCHFNSDLVRSFNIITHTAIVVHLNIDSSASLIAFSDINL